MNQPILTIEVTICKQTILALTKSDKFLSEAELSSKNGIISLMKMIDGNNKVTIPYYKNPCGRIYGSPDINSIWRPLKQTLFHDQYVDIDIINAHTAIIIDICTKHNIECERISEYHNQRDKFLNDIMEFYEVERQAAKTLVTIIMNGGSFKTWAEKHNKEVIASSEINKLYKAYDRVRKSILRISDFEVHREAAKQIHPNNEYDQDTYAFSSILFHIEADHLMKALSIINSNDVVPCHDGFYIRKTIFDDRPNLLDEINDAFSGTNIKFIQKSMDEIIDLTECKKFPINIFEDLELEDLADYVLQNVKAICQGGNLYIYNGFYWEIDEPASGYPLMQRFYCQGCYQDLKCYVESSFDKVLKATATSKKRKRNEESNEDSIEKKQLAKMTANKNKFIKDLKNTREGHRYKQLIEKVKSKTHDPKVRFDTNPNLFAFNNKIFDLQTGLEIKPSSDQMISMTTGYDYKEDHNLEKYKQELKKVFEDILPDEDNHRNVMKFISTGLSGHVQKYFAIFTGSGGNGKTLLQELIKTVLGNYFNVMSSATLLTSKTNGPDQNAASCHKKRLIVVSEPDKSDSMIKSSRIKEFTGNQEVAARAMYQTNTIIENQGTYYMECNGIPNIDSPDQAITRRLLIIPFTSKFVSEQKYNEISKENEGRFDYDIIMEKYKICNEEYKTQAYKNLVRPAMFHMMLEYYQEYLKNPNLTFKEDSQSYNLTTQYLGEGFQFNAYIDANYRKLTPQQLNDAKEKYPNAKDFIDATCIRIDKHLFDEFSFAYDPDKKSYKSLKDLCDALRVSSEYSDYYKHRKQRIGKEYGFSQVTSYQLTTSVLVGYQKLTKEDKNNLENITE